MNKKLFLGMFAAATMLFATSCQNDELDAVQAGNEATVSFTLGVEGGVQTRATISDGSGAKQLHYRVFNEDGSPVSPTLKKEVETVDSYPYEVKMTLAKGQKYKVAFFAKNAECDAYTVDENMQLTIDYEGNNNDEKRDAFFKTVTIDVTGNDEIPVVLKRPFAQINVGVTNEDWAAAIASDIDIQSSKVVIKNAATKMNLIDGSVTTPVEVTYDFGATPKSTNEVLKVDLDGDGTPTEYNYLSMSYILVNDGNGGAERANLDEVEFTFKPTNPAKNPIVLNTGLNGVPVQRNYRTNIIGQLLTGNITFDITIDHNYDGEIDIEDDGTETVYSVRGGNNFYKTLKEALDAGETNILLGEGTYTLSSVTNKSLTIGGIGAKSVLDCSNAIALSGCDLTFENLTIESSTQYYVGLQHIAEATYRNCTIKNTIFLYAPSTFEGCTFKAASNGYSVWTYASTKTTFTDCTFNNDKKAILVFHDCNPTTCELYITDCTFTATDQTTDKAAIEIHTEGDINGTTDNGINGKLYIKNSTQTGFGGGLWRELNNPANKQTSNFEVYVDGAKVYPLITLDGVAYATLEEALAAASDNDVINIASGTYEIPAGGTGKTLKFVGSDAANVTFKPRAAVSGQYDNAFSNSKITFENLTIEVNPNLTQYGGYGHCEGTYKNCVIKNSYTLYGTSVFEDCKFEVTGNKYNVWTWGSDATFTRCTFNCDGKAALVYADDAADNNIVFKNCTFNDSDNENFTKAAIEIGESARGESDYVVTINDCAVNGFAVTAQSGANCGGTSLGTTLWGNKNLLPSARLQVLVDGVQEY